MCAGGSTLPPPPTVRATVVSGTWLGRAACDWGRNLIWRLGRCLKGYTKHHRALSKSQDHQRESESGFHREMSKISECEDDGGIVAMMKKTERPHHWDSFINFVSFFCLSAAPRLFLLVLEQHSYWWMGMLVQDQQEKHYGLRFFKLCQGSSNMVIPLCRRTYFMYNTHLYTI